MISIKIWSNIQTGQHMDLVMKPSQQPRETFSCRVHSGYSGACVVLFKPVQVVKICIHVLDGFIHLMLLHVFFFFIIINLWPLKHERKKISLLHQQCFTWSVHQFLLFITSPSFQCYFLEMYVFILYFMYYLKIIHKADACIVRRSSRLNVIFSCLCWWY